MLGWEFPPFFAGGIGIVCYELTKELTKQGTRITYLMPFGPLNTKPEFLEKLLVAENIEPEINIRKISTGMHAYMTTKEYHQLQKTTSLRSTGSKWNKKNLYGKNLMHEVHLFAHRAMTIADYEDFDIIHCHDWMTIPAAVGIKQQHGKPLVLHVHNTVFDRYLSGSNNVEYDIEQLGLNQADKIICISNYIKNILKEKYSVDERKLVVIHNAVEQAHDTTTYPVRIKEKDRIVLFAGRITLQKGPEYFVRAAKLVAEHNPNVKFVMAGTGDMLPRMIDLAADIGLADKFFFPGFYTREDAKKLFSMADVFVMPSVSEPFGIVPLEAMSMHTPTIISRQSGVSEVVNHVLKVDFWDTEELAEKILAILEYEALNNLLKKHGSMEVRSITWDKQAREVQKQYEKVLAIVTH